MHTYLKAGTIKRLHVDRQKLRRDERLALTVQTSKGPMKAFKVEILGPSTFVRSGLVYSEVDGGVLREIKPLSCGAKAWVETRAAVEVIV